MQLVACFRISVETRGQSHFCVDKLSDNTRGAGPEYRLLVGDSHFGCLRFSVFGFLSLSRFWPLPLLAWLGTVRFVFCWSGLAYPQLLGPGPAKPSLPPPPAASAADPPIGR
jgi:hypothetical protein